MLGRHYWRDSEWRRPLSYIGQARERLWSEDLMQHKQGMTQMQANGHWIDPPEDTHNLSGRQSLRENHSVVSVRSDLIANYRVRKSSDVQRIFPSLERFQKPRLIARFPNISIVFLKDRGNFCVLDDFVSILLYLPFCLLFYVSESFASCRQFLLWVEPTQSLQFLTVRTMFLSEGETSSWLGEGNHIEVYMKALHRSMQLLGGGQCRWIGWDFIELTVRRSLGEACWVVARYWSRRETNLSVDFMNGFSRGI